MHNDNPNGNDSLLKFLLESQKAQREQQQACAALHKTSEELRLAFEQSQRAPSTDIEQRLAQIILTLQDQDRRITALEKQHPQLERALQLALESSAQLNKSVLRRSSR